MDINQAVNVNVYNFIIASTVVTKVVSRLYPNLNEIRINYILNVFFNYSITNFFRFTLF